MSRLAKGFSNPSIASTSQEGQEGVERGTLCVTLLSSEWRSSADGDLSTLIRELAIQLAKYPSLQVSVFLPQCSEDDKRIAAGHKVHLIEAEEITGHDPVDWLINIPEDHAMDCIIGLGVHLGRQIPVIQRNHQCKWIQIVHNAPEALAMYKRNVDALPRGEKMQQTEIELCELADQVVAVGPKLADTYRRFLRSSKKHQDVIDLTPSIFREFLDVKQATEERKTFCILVIGSGDSEDFNLKGYDLAAQAIAELKEKSYELKFVCAPRNEINERNEIAQKLLEHDIDHSQLIVRSFNERRETLARLFCEVDLAIIPSRSEGYGLTGLEALSAGLPVLVSGNSGLGEALMKVPNGSNCVVDSEDPKCWASKIKAVREKDRGVRLEEAKLLREKYLEKYSWEESLDVLVEKMQDLTGSSGRMSASAAYSQLPCAVASQIHERRNYQREDTQRSSDHSGSLSSLEQYQLPCPAGAQTPTQTYQTSHTQSFPGRGSSPSLPEYNQLPFLAGPQTPVQTYQTNHCQTMTLAIDVAAMKLAKQNTQDRTVSAMESEGLQGGEHQAASAMPVSSGQTQASCTGDEAHQVPNPISSKVTEVLCKIAENYLHNSPPRNKADRNEFSEYLKEMRVIITGVSTGSLLITVKCDSLQILERLWDDYLSGHLGEVVQSCFVTEEILTELGLAELTLKTTISEEEYKACNKYLRNESGRVSVKSSPQDPQRPRLVSADEAEASPADMFDVKTCQRKLAEHYQKTAKVPTTAWSSVLQVDLEKIYTRLSWVKQEQTIAGSSQKKKKAPTTAWSSQKELNHYTDIFTEETTNGVVAKRILVQGETGIGKTTFVKKLLLDWSNREEAKMDEERKDALKKFDLVVSINLKEVSKCQTFKEAIIRCGLFPEDDEKSVDNMLRYIRANQDKVLLVFDGYDEYCTGSEAEESFGRRSSSPIFEIFHGNIFRKCTVLVTTRISRADEIRVSADMQAEITGFNMSDRKDFMRKMLVNETDVDGLLNFLRKSKLKDLARIPLLSLFFCLMWKEEKEKLMELTERKAELYQAIVKHILQHSHRRRSSPKASKLKETDYEEILAEIGKVALAGLLKGDLVFEFGQLPEKVRGEKAVIVGLFQFSEYGPSLQPTEMVSFIHKSIQEYLAAWYLIYSCVPKGSLGEIEQHALTLENCVALENVFQFVCGLSEEGAMKVLEHLKSVRISDLSKTIPDVETETDLPQCDFTDKHVRFSGLVYDSFQEVQSKADLLSPFFDCIGGSGIVCISRQRPLQKLMENVNALTKLAQDCAFFLHFIPLDEDVKSTVLYKSLEFLDCLRLPIRITEGSGVLKVEDFMGKWKLNRLNGHLRCFLSSIICFRRGQFQFYITELRLQCDDHARLFTKSTSINFPSDTGSVSSVQSCLKLLSCLRWYKLSPQTVKDLGAVIRNCNCLTTIEVEDGDDSICYLLQHLRNPRKCSVTIGASRVRPNVGVDLTSVGAGQLASLLPRFENLISLCLDLSHCDAAALVTLVSAITHKTLEKLILSGISLTSSGAAALGRSLPEMSSLNVLELSGMDGSILEVEEMEALFGGFHKTLPLFRLAFRNFSSKGCLATLCKSFRLFPHLKELELEKLDINERDQCSLLESLRFLCDLTAISVQETDQQGYVHCYTTKSDRPGIQATLNLDGVRLTPAVAMALGRSLPEMSSLLELRLAGVDGSILQAEDMVALFGGLYKPLPLREFVFTGYCLRGCVSPLNKIFRFFPKVRKLTLEKLSMDENDQCGLLESLKLIPDLQNVASLSVNSKPPVHRNCCTAKLELTTNLFPQVTSKSLILDGISLTTKTSQSLGRFLPQMLSLTTLELTGVRDKSILHAEEIKALFGGFSRMLPLVHLVFSCFKLKGSVAPITKSFRFFPSLKWLELVDYNMDELSLCDLLESLRFLPNLRELIVFGRESGHPSCSTVGASKVCGFAHKALREFELTGLNLTPTVAAVLGQLLPEMSSLQSLCLRGTLGNILQAEEMAACFGGFNKTLPLKLLFFSGFSVRGSLSPLTESFRFFPNLEKLHLEGFRNLSMDEHNLCALLESLRFMPNLKELSVEGEPLGDARCCTEEVNTLASFTHETLEQLKLDKISLAAVSAALLGRLLPGMSSLQVLELSGVDGSILEAEEMEALLGGFNKTLPLYRLAFRNFSSRGCLASLCKSFGFFPSLKELELDRLNMNEHDQCSLLESLRFMPNLRALSIQSEHQEDVRCYTARMNTFSSFTLEDQKGLNFNGINLTQGAAAALGRSLPEMLSLQVLQLMGVKGNILLAETMESLFGRFHKTMALCKLTFSGFSVRGCLAPLIKSLRFFPSLRELRLEKLDIDEHDQCGLLKSFDGIIRDVTELIVRETGKECLNSFYYTSRFYTVDSVTHGRVTRRLELDGFSLTSSIATLLGRLLPEMSSLQSLELTGMHRGMLKAEEMEALFGGFSTTLPLYELTLRSLSARGCLAPLFKSLNFFPNLIELHLGKLNMDEHDLRGLLESFQFIPNLQGLNLSDNPLGHAVTSIVPHVIHLKKLRYLYVLNTGSSEEDLNYVRDTVQQALPELKIRTGLLPEL